VQTLLAREPGDLAIDRSALAAGPHREAYRYLELARGGVPAPSAVENSVTITLKMSETRPRDSS
jgi:hypothetical protein